MNYVLKRIKTCNPNPMWLFVETYYGDINEALRICQSYNDFYCYGKCGCQFTVEEYPNIIYQPSSYTNYIPYAYTTNTGTPSGSYMPWSFITTATANNTYTVSNIGPTTLAFTGDLSGATTAKTY